MILDASYKHCNMTADVPARTSPLFWVHDHIPQISCSLLAQTSAPWTSSGGIATACHERSCESLWIWVFLLFVAFTSGMVGASSAMQVPCSDAGNVGNGHKNQRIFQELQRTEALRALTVIASRGTMRGASSSATMSCQPWVGHTDGSHPNAARVFATQNMVVLVTGEFQVMIAFHLESWSQDRQEFCREPM